MVGCEGLSFRGLARSGRWGRASFCAGCPVIFSTFIAGVVFGGVLALVFESLARGLGLPGLARAFVDERVAPVARWVQARASAPRFRGWWRSRPSTDEWGASVAPLPHADPDDALVAAVAADRFRVTSDTRN